MYFEWKRTLLKMPVNGLYLLDDERSWWHFCFDEILDLLNRYKPDLLVGASMGGYGALLFGSITKTPARTFGPQTVLTKQAWDDRWENHLQRVRELTKYPHFLELDVAGDQFHIHYCKDHEGDRRHAERLNVKLFPHSCGAHPPTQKIANLAETLQ